MSQIVICGGSVIGLATATLLARDGHKVTVLERDASPLPETPSQAWESWDRNGIPQFRQPHNLFPGYCRILDEEMPEVVDDLLESGGYRTNSVRDLPRSLNDRSARSDDDRFEYIISRRPLVEAVHARHAERQPNVQIRRGLKVEGYLANGDSNGVPHLEGVRTSEGDFKADLVIDAMGRRSPAADWLRGVGARAPQVHANNDAFVYYSRYYSAAELPEVIAPVVSVLGTFLVLTLPGDNNSWSITAWIPASDTPLKEFRNSEKFTRVLEACPLHRHWLNGEPITDVLPMAGILDRYCRYVVDGRPVATGFAAVGDASICTNPSAGRGLSVGLIQAQRLRDVVRRAGDFGTDFALDWDAVTERDVAPFYWNQMSADKERLAQLTDVREGRRESASSMPLPPEYDTASQAMIHDADVFRGVMETIGCLALPQDVFARPGMWEKVEAAKGDVPALPSPTREELLQLLG